MKTLTTTLTPPIPTWGKSQIVHPVRIPNRDGDGFSEIIEVRVDAWLDSEGEIFLPGDVSEQIEAFKARHMGLLAPEELHELRDALHLTQKQISSLLQLGEKTWTRWESGRERPTRSMNILLHALQEGKIDLPWLRRLQAPAAAIIPFDTAALRREATKPFEFSMTKSQEAFDESVAA
jgi:DNA-binding transcriptional regulator YiaG